MCDWTEFRHLVLGREVLFELLVCVSDGDTADRSRVFQVHGGDPWLHCSPPIGVVGSRRFAAVSERTSTVMAPVFVMAILVGVSAAVCTISAGRSLGFALRRSTFVGRMTRGTSFLRFVSIGDEYEAGCGNRGCWVWRWTLVAGVARSTGSRFNATYAAYFRCHEDTGILVERGGFIVSGAIIRRGPLQTFGLTVASIGEHPSFSLFSAVCERTAN